MISALQAALLGVVQGLTEFIPVSSSGHLVLLPRLFGWNDPGIAFDVAVHVGTLLAVLVFFRREWVSVIRGFFTSFRVKPGEWDGGQRLAWLLILATVPAAAAGAALEGHLSDHMRTTATVAWFLLAGSLAMVLAEVSGRGSRELDGVLARDAGTMGLFQALALAPGMSRSGITISAGMVSGLKRDAAARFSFLMAAPVIAGAGIFECVKIAREGLQGGSAGVMAAGFATSGLTGFFAIKYLLRYLQRRSLLPFVIYGVAVSAVILMVLALK